METLETTQLLKTIIADLKELKTKSILEKEWMSRAQLMEFLQYGATQIAELDKKGKLVIAQVGRRKFYSVDSVNKMLQDSIAA